MAPMLAAADLTASNAGQSGHRIRWRWPSRSAAMASPGASAQSRMSMQGVFGHALQTSSTSARHQPGPPRDAAPAAEINATGAPCRSTRHACARPWTTIARYPAETAACGLGAGWFMLDVGPWTSLNQPSGVCGMSMTIEPDPDDLATELARLEQALDRIDYLASSTVPSAVASVVDPHPVSSVLLDRLDSMIARLRAAIDEA